MRFQKWAEENCEEQKLCYFFRIFLCMAFQFSDNNEYLQYVTVCCTWDKILMVMEIDISMNMQCGLWICIGVVGRSSLETNQILIMW